MTRRVLVARLDSLGDVLLCGPAVRAIAAAGSEVWMLCSAQGAQAARLLPGVHRVLEWECPWIVNPAPPVTPALVDQLTGLLAECDPDEAVILTSFHQSPLPLALLLRLAGVTRIAGASVDFAGSLLDVRLRPGEDLAEDQPEPERAMAIARAAGFELPADDDGALRVDAVPDAADIAGAGDYVVVHPGVAVPARAWPTDRHQAAVQLLVELGLRVVVTGSPSETALTAQVAGRFALDLGGRLDLPTLAGVLAGASAVIVANTGPAHLAAAVGTPVVSLFAPVVPAIRWAPYGVPVELLGDQTAPCRGTRARECPVAGHPCLTSVTPADVVDACLRLLAESPSRPEFSRGVA
ncbi:glycosyltransferase family 9 protein [Salinibacterium sp. ZJ454]|uniref:glycosyltransferase family 9 protein n=1 Tax=Salinibacterium sp. ZJ454 TaxID=2708339 RepID=UPI001FBA40D3|nr:glycosyltransferase family 9 protein [Salinibacterium sp. ZJ454]